MSEDAKKRAINSIFKKKPTKLAAPEVVAPTIPDEDEVEVSVAAPAPAVAPSVVTNHGISGGWEYDARSALDIDIGVMVVGSVEKASSAADEVANYEADRARAALAQARWNAQQSATKSSTVEAAPAPAPASTGAYVLPSKRLEASAPSAPGPVVTIAPTAPVAAPAPAPAAGGSYVTPWKRPTGAAVPVSGSAPAAPSTVITSAPATAEAFPELGGSNASARVAAQKAKIAKSPWGAVVAPPMTNFNAVASLQASGGAAEVAYVPVPVVIAGKGNALSEDDLRAAVHTIFENATSDCWGMSSVPADVLAERADQVVEKMVQLSGQRFAGISELLCIAVEAATDAPRQFVNAVLHRIVTGGFVSNDDAALSLVLFFENLYEGLAEDNPRINTYLAIAFKGLLRETGAPQHVAFVNKEELPESLQSKVL